MYPVFATRSYTYTRAHSRMRVPTRLRTHARARIGGAAAHNGPPRTDDPAESVPPAVARRPGRKRGAYRGQCGDRGGAPRADVRAERRRRVERLRAEPPAVDADRTRSHVSARMRGSPIAHAHTRARTDAARARVCAAGLHRRSVHRCSQTRMDIDTCMQCVYVHSTQRPAPHRRPGRARPAARWRAAGPE